MFLIQAPNGILADATDVATEGTLSVRGESQA